MEIHVINVSWCIEIPRPNHPLRGDGNSVDIVPEFMQDMSWRSRKQLQNDFMSRNLPFGEVVRNIEDHSSVKTIVPRLVDPILPRLDL